MPVGPGVAIAECWGKHRRRNRSYHQPRQVPGRPLQPSSAALRFLSTREGSNSWARDPQFLAAAKSGDFIAVRPRTLEIAPVLSCDLRCHRCSYWRPRQAVRAPRVPLGQFAVPNGTTVATCDTVELVLRRAAAAGIEGVVWTGGGEPTLWDPLPSAIAKAFELGMENGLYTNGTQLGCHAVLVEALLELPLLFIRVSLNAVTPVIARRFAGATPAHVDAQILGLRRLLIGRAQRQGRTAPLPAIQISVIVDAVNIEDLPQISDAVVSLYRECAGGVCGPDDYFLVRPLTVHSGSEYSLDDHGEALIRQILAVVGQKGSHARKITDAGLRLCLGFGLDQLDRGEVGNYPEIRRREYAGRDKCLSNGYFLTVGPDATVYLCCDRNCDRNWAIGNLKHESVEQIWNGAKRVALLEHVNCQRCGPLVCEATCRVPRLNRIFEAIRRGELTPADIEAIAQVAQHERRLLLS